MVSILVLLFFTQFVWCDVQQTPCYNNCSFGKGICDIPSDTCNCTGGYHGVLCQFAPTQNECNAPPDCGQDLCDGWSCSGTPKICKRNPVVCPTGNLCLVYGSCVPATGLCVLIQNRSCNDGNGCTDDSCNPTTGACSNVNRSCSYLDTSCKIGYCVPSEPIDTQCYVNNIACPNPNGCGSVFCVQNTTFCGCEYKLCPVGTTNPPTPPPTPCKTARPTSAPTSPPNSVTTGGSNAPIAPTSPTSQSGGGLSLGAIIGIAVGGGVGLIILIIVIVLIVWKVSSSGTERV